MSERTPPAAGREPDEPRGVGAAARQPIPTARLVTPVVSVVVAVLVGSIVIRLAGGDPLVAFQAMFLGAFGGTRQIGETLLRATPLVFTGLAVAYGFRTGLFNIGAEGQLFLGGLAAAFIGVKAAGLPWALSVPVVLVSAAVAGAAWAFVPALLKARIGAHEVITTMMFTYIGRYLVSWVILYRFKDEGAIPQTPELPASSQLPRISDVVPLIEPNRAHLGIVLGAIAAVAVWWILRSTVIGFEARAVGFNPAAAETAGISVPVTTVRSLCISGALAGLAGAVVVMGEHHRLFDQFSSGLGFTGIAVALLAKNNPLAVIAAAVLFGSLQAGAGRMQLEAGVSPKVIAIIQGAIIFMIGAEAIVTWVVRRARRGVGGRDAR